MTTTTTTTTPWLLHALDRVGHPAFARTLRRFDTTSCPVPKVMEAFDPGKDERHASTAEVSR